MQVSFKVSLSMELLHKLTMQKLVINEDMFGGYIINPKDFCAIKVGKIDVSINKK